MLNAYDEVTFALAFGSQNKEWKAGGRSVSVRLSRMDLLVGSDLKVRLVK